MHSLSVDFRMASLVDKLRDNFSRRIPICYVILNSLDSGDVLVCQLDEVHTVDCWQAELTQNLSLLLRNVLHTV